MTYRQEDWKLEKYELGLLVREVAEKRLAVPGFQRNYDWAPKDWEAFLGSVIEGRPIGNLLLLEVEGDSKAYNPRPIESGPTPPWGSPLRLILDGQQRSTTLYQAFQTSFRYRKKAHHFVLDVDKLLDSQDPAEAFLKLESSSIPSPADQAKSGVVHLPILLDDPKLSEWQDTYAARKFKCSDPSHSNCAEKSCRLRSLFDSLEPKAPALRFGVSKYTIPVMVLSGKKEPQDIVDAFERLNSKGKPLTVFDLMNARMYNRGPGGQKFDLQSETERGFAETTHLDRLGIRFKNANGIVTADALLPLQLLALKIAAPNKVLGEGHGVHGITSRDIFQLPAEAITGRTVGGHEISVRTAIIALDHAAKFLFEECGVVSPNLLPQRMMLIPLADQMFLTTPEQRLKDPEMKRWFFAASLLQEFHGKTSTYAKRHAEILSKWARSPRNAPEFMGSLTRQTVNDLDLTKPLKDEHRISGLAILSMLVADRAKDWRKGRTSVSSIATKESVELHHIIPENRVKLLKGVSGVDSRFVALMTPISSSRNQALGKASPEQVIEDLGDDSEAILESHLVIKNGNLKEFHNGWKSEELLDQFIRSRSEELKQFVNAYLNL